MKISVWAVAFLGAIVAATSVGASATQDPTPTVAPAPVEPPAPAGEEWQTVAQSARITYLADVSNLVEAGGEITIRVARVPRQRTAPTDYSYSIREYAVRCSSNETRIAATVEHGADGQETDRFAEDESWSEFRPNSVDATIKGIACDRLRSTPTFETVRAYMEQNPG